MSWLLKEERVTECLTSWGRCSRWGGGGGGGGGDCETVRKYYVNSSA